MGTTIMDDKSLEMLEFPHVREIVAGYTSFSASRGLVNSLRPLTDYQQVALLLRQSGEARRLLTLESGFSIGGVFDIREATGMAAKGKVLEPLTLVEVQQTLAAAGQLRGRLSKLSQELPLLWEIAGGIIELKQLEKDIESCLAPNGELFDHASPKLAATRRQLREVRQQLSERLEAIMRTPRGRRIVQEPIITEREGRYVIPVKTEFQKEIRGIVHDVSNTGATAFIEPLVTMELGNTLRELLMEERREVERILSRLSADVGANHLEISQNIDRVAELDVALAKARYAQKARAAEPVITSFDGTGKESSSQPAGTLRLIDARHPLLGEKAVPLSVELGSDFSILVITGPNTGGKTVALKTIGLLSLMAQAGIPIPASADSRMPVFDGVFADIGDEQSIEQTLSTFSWHIGNMVRILKNSSARSLVLLDELGTSTDPAEGSALARAILLHFLSRGTMAVATTHFGDLKAFAHVTAGIQNASLDFDPVTLAPTYRLRVGLPGGSNALATASRLGLPSEIISSARDMLSKGAQELEALLADLTGEKQWAESLHQELEKEMDRVAQRSAELASELQRLKTEERRAIEEIRDQIVTEAAELQKEIRQASAELRRAKSRDEIDRAKKTLAAMQDRLKGDVWQPKPEVNEEVAAERPITVGDTVWLKEANLEAKVLSVLEETQQVDVQAGQTRFRLNLNSVTREPAAGKAAPEVARVITTPSRKAASMELDLRGKRVIEIEWLLDSFLNEAAMANLSQVRIIHGFGTGAVRQVVRDALASHPLVKSSRPGERGEGGDGVTVAKL
ncbi:MAG: endonuclease MutS2 [Dehalococcoidales bacterium]|nr:endonuclease MutS2 [Dehalococcoidales bacterium]